MLLFVISYLISMLHTCLLNLLHLDLCVWITIRSFIFMSHFGLCELFLFLLKLLNVTTFSWYFPTANVSYFHVFSMKLSYEYSPFHHHHYFIKWVFFNARIDTFKLLLQSKQSLLPNCDINQLWSGPTSFFCYNFTLYCNIV